jgi:hypothetical protein
MTLKSLTKLDSVDTLLSPSHLSSNGARLRVVGSASPPHVPTHTRVKRYHQQTTADQSPHPINVRAATTYQPTNRIRTNQPHPTLNLSLQAKEDYCTLVQGVIHSNCKTFSGILCFNTGSANSTLGFRSSTTS